MLIKVKIIFLPTQGDLSAIARHVGRPLWFEVAPGFHSLSEPGEGRRAKKSVKDSPSERHPLEYSGCTQFALPKSLVSGFFCRLQGQQRKYSSSKDTTRGHAQC
ncbi:hypothetical protein PGT21_018151 [Puccinia graminis f. sp. tritici]|uniref:Uncharacterized protein n=1 Tax=Puccinia graminis f. sp. tritici TaxID=56615 RepID=A0A5B0SFY8_PUCGR|nr:hypothetical protein PGT21_018151 [Puccinia graminis f. sp. tritici]KAA1136153.1 hypothetical protein PGTUg99_033703 [Puccinia graminis f. sp. tritici]